MKADSSLKYLLTTPLLVVIIGFFAAEYSAILFGNLALSCSVSLLELEVPWRSYSSLSILHILSSQL